MGQEISPYESLLKENLEISKTTQITAIALSYPPGRYGQIQTHFILHMHESLKTTDMKILRGKKSDVRLHAYNCRDRQGSLASRPVRNPASQTVYI